FLECRDRKRIGGNGRTTLNIAKSGLGAGGRDAKSDQAARLGMRCSCPDDVAKALDVANAVVGREYQKHRVLTIGDRFHSSQRNGRRRVSRQRLKNDATALQARHAQLLGNDETMIFVTNDDGVGVLQAVKAGEGALEHGRLILAVEREKLLGE